MLKGEIIPDKQANRVAWKLLLFKEWMKSDKQRVAPGPTTLEIESKWLEIKALEWKGRLS